MGSNLIKRSRAFVTIWLSMLVLPLCGQASISVSQSIDRTDMAFEDTAGFRIVITWHGPAHAYRFEKPFRLQTDRLKVVRFSSTIRSTGSGPDEITTKTFDYKLAPSLSGIGTIEPLDIEYLSWPDSLTGTLVTDPIAISIGEPLPPELEEEGGISGGWIAVIVVCVLGAAVGIFSLAGRRAPQKTTRTPVAAFLDDLEEVKKESGRDLKKFQTGLYKNLVRYIERRYHLSSVGESAEALTVELNKVERDQAICQALSGWLVRAEKEKYAPLELAPGEVTRLETEVRQFFEKLK